MHTMHTTTNTARSLSYSQARALIRTGDTVCIATGTPGGRLIELGQRMAGLPFAHLTHCGVAVWMGGRLLLAEMGPGGNVLKPLSQYAGKRMAVCVQPAGVAHSHFDTVLDDLLDQHIPYSLGDLVRIGLRLAPSRFIDTQGWGGDGDSDKVCSLLPAMFYARMGADVSAIPKLAAPAEVVRALTVRFEIEGF
jgi:hypothetical protein